MSGLLFLLDVVAVVLIAWWIWGLERGLVGGWRLRLLDTRGQVEAEPARARTPAWRLSTPSGDSRGPRPAVSPGPPPPRPRRPGWRRGV